MKRVSDDVWFGSEKINERKGERERERERNSTHRDQNLDLPKDGGTLVRSAFHSVGGRTAKENEHHHHETRHADPTKHSKHQPNTSPLRTDDAIVPTSDKSIGTGGAQGPGKPLLALLRRMGKIAPFANRDIPLHWAASFFGQLVRVHPTKDLAAMRELERFL